MSKNTSIIFVKTDKWEGSKFEDGKFKRAFVDTDLMGTLSPHFQAALSKVEDLPVGSHVAITINIEEPDGKTSQDS